MSKSSDQNTEDPLLKSKVIIRQPKRNRCKCVTGSCGLLTYGIVATSLSILLTIWTPLHVVMNERLRMRPGLPPYDWWKTPPDKVLLRVYLFNVTNSEAFLNGVDKKLHLEEVGPIVFLEKLEHTNVKMNENDTLTYTAKRSAIYLPEMNRLDLNQSLVVPNIPVLGIASYLWDSSFLTKLGYNILLRSHRSQTIVNTTIYNYLWNFSDPVLEFAQTVVPSMVPTKNMGILSRVYDHFEHTLTVKIGPKHGHGEFFLIDKLDGSEYVPYFNCEDKIVNSTEGVTYPQFLTKNTTLLYWRKTACKVLELDFEREVYTYGVNAYRFVLRNTTFHRNESSECFVGDPPLPNGVVDISKCHYNLPLSASFPHFLNADEVTSEYVTGLKPSVEKHGSFVHVEPITGIPIESKARLQCNIVIKELHGFNEMVEKFGNMVYPMFWLEYNQTGLPPYIAVLMFFIVNILPHLQVIISLALFGTGLALTVLSVYKFVKKEKYKIVQNKIFRLKKNMPC